MTYYLGIANSFHDSAVAVVDNQGKLVFAEATERYLQNKRAVNNSPDQFKYIESVIDRYCDPDEPLVLARSWSENVEHYLKADDSQEKFERFLKTADSDAIPGLLWDQYYFARFSSRASSGTLETTTANLCYGLSQHPRWRGKDNPPLRKYNHHLTHAASACYTAPFAEGACAVIDGYGEARSNNCYTYQNGVIAPLTSGEQPNRGSLGLFYMFICKVCGFGLFNGEEWKVMGLAAYGKFDKDIYNLIKPLVVVEGVDIVQPGFAETYQIYKKLEAYRRKPESSALTVADLAHTAQVVFEETLFEYLTNLHKVTGSEQVMLGGGCLLNSSATGKITANTPFRSAYVYSAPADDGNAVGAALLAYYEDHPGEKREPGFQSPYLGASMSQDKIEKFKQFGGQKAEHLGDGIIQKAAELLVEGKIIGWAQGRAEFGPRALGNRSILADPRSQDVKDRINARVKFREEFRPFAPSILHEFGPEYFENYQESPYMERTLAFKEDKKEVVPGVVHEDGTGRLQSVKREWNAKYYDLIRAFYDITGVPLVLNTSFNVMGKPIIHSVEDALAVFYTSGLDALIIGDLLIEK